MNIEDTLEDAGKTIKQGRVFYERALEKTKEGAGMADKLLHRNAYNMLAAGILAGFVAGLLASRGCLCQSA